MLKRVVWYCTMQVQMSTRNLHLTMLAYSNLISYNTDEGVGGILWDLQWSPPSIRVFPHRCWFVYRNAFLSFQVSERSKLYNCSTIDVWKIKCNILSSYFLIIIICISFYTSSVVFWHVIFWESVQVWRRKNHIQFLYEVDVFSLVILNKEFGNVGTFSILMDFFLETLSTKSFRIFVYYFPTVNHSTYHIKSQIYLSQGPGPG